MKRSLFCLSIIAYACIFQSFIINAQTVTWDGGAGTNNWHDATNWDTDAEPTAIDSVVIPEGKIVCVTQGGKVARAVTLMGKTTLRIKSGDITIDNDTTSIAFRMKTGGLLQVDEGEIAAPTGIFTTCPGSNPITGTGVITDGLIPQGTCCDDASGYCCAAGKDTGDTYITKFKVSNGGLNHNTGDDEGYGKFIDQIVQNNNANRYKIVLKGVSQGNVKKYWRIYVDLNDNLEFDEGEKLFQKASTGTVKGYFKISCSVTGDRRIRVVMSTGGFVGACENPENGEIEDYTFRRTSTRSLVPTYDLRSATTFKSACDVCVNVFPNPVSRELTIQWEHAPTVPRTIEIINSLGVSVFKESRAGDVVLTQVYFSSWASGLYHYRINGPTATITGSIVKLE